MRFVRCRIMLGCCLGFATPATAQAEVFCVGRGDATHASLAQAVAAAAANGPGTDAIFLDSITHAVPDTVVIENQSLQIVGGFPFCETQLAPTGIATIDGAGGGVGSVIEIRAAGTTPHEVTLDRVVIRGGENDGTGGGLHIGGSFFLTVRLRSAVSITANTSNFGGGIFLGQARLHLEGASILGNTAVVAGGGLDCVSTQFFVEAASSVRFNRAGRGGGYSLRDDCGVVFYGGNALSLFGNEADEDGGGLVASHSNALVQVVRGPASQPGPIDGSGAFRVAANRAGVRGGGMALLQGADLHAAGLVMVSNNVTVTSATPVEPMGGAIFAGSGSVVSLQADTRCAPGEPCNRLINNAVNRNAAAFASGGAGLATIGASEVAVDSAEFSGNTLNGGPGTASAVLLVNTAGSARISRSLFHGNGSADGSSVPQVLQITTAAAAELHYLTLADNSVSGSGRAVLRLSQLGALDWRSSIVDQPGEPIAVLSGVATPLIDCLLARELGSVAGATRSLAAAPVFVDRANADYRPAAGSPQVDYCDGPPADPGQAALLDLDRAPVPADAVTVDIFGPYDLGAYESQAFLLPGRVFANGFEP